MDDVEISGREVEQDKNQEDVSNVDPRRRDGP